MEVGVGKSLMAFVILSNGLIESKVTVNPAKSTTSAAKTNFEGLNITPLRPQRSIYATVCQKESRTVGLHKQLSSSENRSQPLVSNEQRDDNSYDSLSI